ncbi:hypothetical protein HDU97_009749 [Phlyctochytrium planicorne]|nr:hypothetical protein HDU97_009749 [Phlyctochytrium planicorne]
MGDGFNNHAINKNNSHGNGSSGHDGNDRSKESEHFEGIDNLQDNVNGIPTSRADLDAESRAKEGERDNNDTPQFGFEDEKDASAEKPETESTLTHTHMDSDDMDITYISLCNEIQEFQSSVRNELQVLQDDLIGIAEEMSNFACCQIEDFGRYIGHVSKRSMHDIEQEHKAQEISKQQIDGFYKSVKESFGLYLQAPPMFP